MNIASATITSFGIDLRVRRGLATVSFIARSGQRMTSRLAPEGDSSRVIIAAAEELLESFGIEVSGSWTYVEGGLRSTGYYS